ncbi:TorD/DmsD family molecular chaperone [Vibrio parahaemolyticus]|uniref:TorD/DmsD family molecular chaperone n=1 Tax=Vibrio parahaemolyticus TaxID=670 RepID=UPI0004DEE948|nr:molecular chaperone TorD family protein [Vibrio parahaemolyticus]EKB1951077.1 molecular chaperone TorD family protein [Vibrio parahaemolyticus]MBM4850036.1 molecular chaperone TorD family protein [Vibrio parahaemolyticus]MDK9426008.1 molecular chaperone TorD family protein [Vibrio parahaemolyticus]MDK9436022.1 molecular chaperone TorD family protein [Vibrio parahaemolyticus]MDK9437574.1 molecular chaperone TorD family protein [Vibrio parahaemolyticus]
MQISQLEPQDTSIVLKLFGALFYYQPKDYPAANLDTLLSNTDTPIEALNDMLRSFQNESEEALQMEHDRMFAGIGEMPAPPWGSAYLDKEAVLFGESTIEYRYFLQRCGFALESDQREPEDQIGLMLMVLGMLIETDQQKLAAEMLREHLMTWFGFFNKRFNKAVTLTPYSKLSNLTEELLQSLSEQYQVVVSAKRDYSDAPV